MHVDDGNKRSASSKRKFNRWAHKVKTGCITCRARRVKCDETTPECRRCISAGKHCEGYRLAVHAQTALILQPRDALAPADLQPTQREIIMFSLLQSETVGQVAGFFDHNFWANDALLAARTYPAIWHASLAMAAMHNRALITKRPGASREAAREQYLFSLTQYNHSIRHIMVIVRKGTATDHLSLAEQETLLMTNLLFIGICCLQNDIAQAVFHAKNLLAFFHKWKFWENRQTHGRLLSAKSLVTLVTNVKSQFTNRVDYLPALELCTDSEVEMSSTTLYYSITDCYCELQAVLVRMQRTYRKMSAPSVTEEDRADLHAACCQEIRDWRDRFRLLKQKTSIKPADEQGMLILEIMSSGLQLCISIGPGDSMHRFEKFRYIFLRIVTLSEKLYTVMHAGGVTPSSFSFSLSICEVLHFAGANCSDPAIRLRAVALLDKWPSWDGIWDPKSIALICKVNMVFEECPETEGCECANGDSICEAHRACFAGTSFLSDRDMRLVLKTLADYRLKKDWEGNSYGLEKIHYFWQSLWTMSRQRQEYGQNPPYGNANADTRIPY